MTSKNPASEHSAGGVVYKKENGDVVWLIVKHSGYRKWVFPKGHVERNESVEDAATREVKEEAGISARIVAKIPHQEKYTFTLHGKRISKVVDYFLMEYTSGSVEDHDWEVEEVKWCSFNEANALLGFENAKEMLSAAQVLLKQTR